MQFIHLTCARYCARKAHYLVKISHEGGLFVGPVALSVKHTRLVLISAASLRLKNKNKRSTNGSN